MNDQTEQSGQTEAKSGAMRQGALILVLLLMLGALYWDRQVARPNSLKMSETLDQKAQERLGSSDKQLSAEEVATILGRGPSRKREADSYETQTFSWRGGLPWRTYDVNVVFTKTSDGLAYLSSTYNTDPEPQYLPGYVPPQPSNVPPPSGDDIEGGPAGPPGGGGGFESPGGGGESTENQRPPVDDETEPATPGESATTPGEPTPGETPAPPAE